MYSKKVCVINPTGLHARPAADFVKCAAGFSANIHVGRPGDAPVNGKSVIQLMTQGLVQGTEIEIIAEGDDEQEAVDTLVALVESGLGET